MKEEWFNLGNGHWLLTVTGKYRELNNGLNVPSLFVIYKNSLNVQEI